MTLGEMATLTQTLPDETVIVVAEALDRKVEMVSAAEEEAEEVVFEDEEEDLQERPPVVTIMGHVDHGKTSLLDAIRQTEVVAGEAGGITQHIGAYQVHSGEKTITFIDTPGHAAFTAMRARGADVTDIVVVVVAADDGVMPQTVEAIDHARAADVPIIVAVNKIDLEAANIDKVKGEFANLDLQPEDWGGDTIFNNVSAKAKTGLDELLESILLVAEVEELRANPDAEASGSVIESHLDPGRGPVVDATRPARHASGRRLGRRRRPVGQGAGDAQPHRRARRDRGTRRPGRGPGVRRRLRGRGEGRGRRERPPRPPTRRRARTPPEDRGDRSPRHPQAHARRGLRQGAGRRHQGAQHRAQGRRFRLARGAQDELAKVPQEQVRINVIRAAAGGINESDVMLASASDAIIIGFNVRPLVDARRAAESEGVEIRSYSVIYKVTEELRAAMEGMLDSVEVEDILGQAEVKQTFRASRVGMIAGCEVTDGVVRRGADVRLVRDGTVAWTGRIGSLRRFQDDVSEVPEGQECGIVLEGFADIKVEDVLEVFATRQVEQTLDS